MKHLFRRLSHQIRQPQRREVAATMFVLRRDRDGKVWAGPYRWTGVTFTESKRFWWGTATAAAMQARVADEGFSGVSVVEIRR